MDSQDWNSENTPSLRGKTAVVTGANTGLGFETAKVFASKNARVILACRNMDKAAEAKNKILSDLPNATIKLMEIDLSRLPCIHSWFSATL